MMKTPSLKIIALTATLLGSAACAGANQPNAQTGAKSEVPAASKAVSKVDSKAVSNMLHSSIGKYKKPGASVDISHDYEGKSRSGQIEAITVFFTEPHDSGTLTITPRADSELEMYSDISPVSFDMAYGSDHRMDIQVGMPNAGTYYLNFSAATELNGQVMLRSHSLKFDVDGANAALKSEDVSAQNATDAPSGGIIVMDAQETITVLD